MIILDTINKSLEVVLSSPVTTNELQFNCSWADITPTTFAPSSDDGLTNGIVAVTVLPPPPVATQRQLKFLSVYNADTAIAVVTLQFNNNSIIRIIGKWSLPQGYTIIYNLDSGFDVYDTNGAIVTVGNTGASGYSGYSGVGGQSGFSGYSGKSGFSGYSGIGTSGFSGYSGYSGADGQSGFSGYSGKSGYSGYSGISGFSGYSGVDGQSGFSGYSGKSGFSGYSGISGFSGYSGTGTSGFSGYSGYSGISGFSGYSGTGTSGFSGYSGYSGKSGFSGYSGYSGTSGFSGYSGYSGSGMFIYWNSGANLSNNNYLLYGGQDATENHAQILITKTLTIQNLYVNLTNAPSGVDTRTFTVRKNGVNTALTVTITGASVTGSDLVNTVSVVAGDLISILHTRSAGANASVGMASVQTA